MIPFGNKLGKTRRNVIGFLYQRLSDAPISGLTLRINRRAFNCRNGQVSRIKSMLSAVGCMRFVRRFGIRERLDPQIP